MGLVSCKQILCLDPTMTHHCIVGLELNMRFVDSNKREKINSFVLFKCGSNRCDSHSSSVCPPVLLSKNWMCRSSWAVMVIGSVGWLSTLLILQGASAWRRTWEEQTLVFKTYNLKSINEDWRHFVKDGFCHRLKASRQQAVRLRTAWWE